MGKLNSENSFDSIREQQNTELNKLRLVFEQTPGAIFILDKDFKFEYVNPSFTKLSGYSKEELLGRTVAELFYHKDLPESRNDIVKSLLNGEKWQGELLTFNKNGSTYWANTIAAPYRDKTGNIDGYVVIQQDITEKKQMLVSLEESEKFYRTLIESSMDAVSLNQNGKFLLVNSAFCSMFGYTTEEIFSMVPESFIAPEDHDRVMDLHYKRMHGDIEKQNYTATFIHKSGKRVLTELNAATVQVNGQNASFITMSDITERNEMEKALRESEAKYKTLVENSQDGIIIIRDDKILFINNTLCNVLGYTCDCDCDLLMQTPSVNLIYPEDRYKVLEIAKRRQNHDLSTISEMFRMVAKDGSIRECETLSTLIEFDGQWASFFTIHDVTEKRKTQEALAKSEQKYRELADFLPQTVYELDNRGNLLYMNKSGMIAFGISEADYGESALDSFIPEDRERMIENLKMTAIGKRATPMNEYTAVHRNGTTFPVMIYGVPMVQNGIPIGTRGMIVDISDRKAMENALRESESKYKTLIEKATDGIVITQLGKLMFVNDRLCQMLQYSEKELVGMPFIDLAVEEDRQVMNDFHKRRMAGEDFIALYRSRIIRKDGKILTVELNARTSDYNGNPAAFIIIRDISDRIKIENELQTAKNKLELLNTQLEKRVKESSESLTEARTQLINLQKENLQSQFDVLKQQVNPHFLFNSLNVLTSLIKLEPDLAEKFSEQLSKVYRYVLENKDNELVDLNTELNFLDAYIFLLNIRFVDKLRVNINIPADRRGEQIIPLAMQLLIENAIKHNIMSKSEPLSIDIFIDDENFLNIVNNLQERPSQLVSTGVGLKNIQNRYLLLNNTEPVFEKTNTHFIAKVPLVIVE